MRLWHKDLINVLPKNQLIAQWRECCCIAKNIITKGTPNHILVNPIMDYPIEEFIYYTYLVYMEMCRRNYKVNILKFTKYFSADYFKSNDSWQLTDLFTDWHNERYLYQCFYNLEEKFDRGGISLNEFTQIITKKQSLMNKEVIQCT